MQADGELVIDSVGINPAEIVEGGSYDLAGLFLRLGLAVDQVGAKRVVLDPIETLFFALPNEAIVRGELSRLFRWLKDRGLANVVTGEPGRDQLTRHGIEKYVSDCVILLTHRVARRFDPTAADPEVPGIDSGHERVPVPDQRAGDRGAAGHLTRAGLHRAHRTRLYWGVPA